MGFESIPFGRSNRLSYQGISSTRTQSQLCTTFKLKTYKRFFVHWEDAVYFVSCRLFWENQPPEISVKKGVLKNFTKFTGKHLCWKHLRWCLFFYKVAGLNFIKKTPTQVFYCEFCEIFKNTFFTEHLPATAYVFYSVFDSVDWILLKKLPWYILIVSSVVLNVQKLLISKGKLWFWKTKVTNAFPPCFFLSHFLKYPPTKSFEH